MDEDDEKAGELAVAAFFHGMRGERKKAAKDKPNLGSGVLHHRANTDWWNDALGRRR